MSKRKAGRPKKHKSITIDQRKDRKGYNHAYYEKRHELDSYLQAAKAISPPVNKENPWKF